MMSSRDHRIIPQSDGNIYEVFNVASRNEKGYSLSSLPSYSAAEGFPLIVGHTGYGLWGEGAAFRRRRCTVFAIELVTAGSARFIQNGKEYTVEPGMVYVLQPGAINEQATGDCGFLHKRYVEIGGPGLDSMLEHLHLAECDVCRLGKPRELIRLMREATRLLRDKPDTYLSDLSVVAYRCLLLLSLDFAPRRHPPAVSAVLHLLDRRIHETVTIRELAAAAGLSPSQLHRTFRKHLGETPMGLFEKTRMQAAAHRLRSSLVPIGEVAREFGFGDPAYFSNLFRKVMGVSPSGYRKGEKG